MSTPYGMPPTPPTGGTAVPPRANRTPLFIALACGCALLLLLGAVAAGVGLFMIGQGGSEEPTDPPTSVSEEEDPSTEPTTGLETDQPIEQPTEGPESDATTPAGESLSLTVSAPEEGATLDQGDGPVTSTNGKFVGVAVSIWNKGDEEIGLSSANFRFFDADGTEHDIVYGSFSTSGPQIAPDEEATALLYADVPEDVVLAEISYTDEVGTDGTEVRLPVDG